MQETAMQNVIKMGVSVWDLEPQQISWVLMRFLLNVKRIPKLGEQIKIETYPAGFEKFYTYRDYKVFDAQNELIAYASSTWLLMNTIKRRVVRIPDFILAFDMPDEQECLTRPVNKLPPFGTSFDQKTFQVNWHDLDFNQHLSNVHYAKWMIESMEAKLLKNAQLKQFDILFRSEALWQQEIISQIEKVDDLTYQHRLVRSSDQKELAQARSFWIMREN